MRNKAGITLLVASFVAMVAVAMAAAATDGAGRVQASAAAGASSKCAKLSFGFAGPITGPAASLGALQLSWVKFAVAQWNAKTKAPKFSIIQGDTQLPNVAEGIKAAKQLASDKRVWAVVGPAGSQEVQDTFASFKAGHLGFVSGSASRTSLTDGTRKGYFFRTVPNDSVQGPTVASYIADKLKAKNVYIIDDQEAYSQGLADTVEAALKAKGISTTRDSIDQKATDFSSIIAKIPSSTNVVYIPWQLSSQAQNFGQQLKTAGKNATLFGSDGLFDEANFKIPGSYISFFPVKTTSGTVAAYKKAHGGKGDYFGAPSAAAAGIVMQSIALACNSGHLTRDAIRKNIAAATIPASKSVLSVTVHFTANGDLKGGSFGVWKIGADGTYSSVG
ncbi:MAG: branched-chain amino acid ABC transporter substrate-binding protein [Gaiellaceae bacterium]